MNSEAFERSNRERKVSCLLSALDRMKNEIGATDENLFDFASGLADKDWIALTAEANASCFHGGNHQPPSADAKRDVIDALFARLPNGKTNTAKVLSLTARLRRRNMQVVR